jgi:RNA polymerase sigma-70 factor (ECF subfamily)
MTAIARDREIARLFRDHSRRVGRWAARLSGSAFDADDIVQEVFLTAHRQLGRTQTVHSPPAWLLQITRNVVRHVWRSRHRAERRSGVCELDSVVAPGLDPHQALERRRDAEQLHAAISALKESYREVYWLSDVNELPPADVAALTGLRPAAVRVRRFRARRQLARQLERAGAR